MKSQLTFNKESIIQQFTDFINSLDNQNGTELHEIFKKFPKGGDLHYNIIGSMNNDWIVEQLIELDTEVDMDKLIFATDDSCDYPKNTKQFSLLSEEQQVITAENYKQTISYYKSPPEQDYLHHFFNSFNHLRYLGHPPLWNRCLQYTKNYARENNLLYIETIYDLFDHKKSVVDENLEKVYSSVLEEITSSHDVALLQKIILEMQEKVRKNDKFFDGIKQTLKTLEDNHKLLQIDEDDFILRYIFFSHRNRPIFYFVLENFFNFEAASIDGYSNLLVGIKSIGCENQDDSLKYFWIQMRVFKIFRKLYPSVLLSLHAGELNQSMVDETHRNHITEGVDVVNAERIGLANDIRIQKEYKMLMQRMKEKGVVIELCVKSNFFLVGDHYLDNAFFQYFEHGVPISVCTDDVGTFLIDISKEYMKLAHMIKIAFPERSIYEGLKEMSLNGIRGAFIRDKQLKAKLLQVLQEKFEKFQFKNIEKFIKIQI